MTEGTHGVQPILSRSQVARLLGISLTTLWRLVNAKRFPPAIRISPGRVGWPARSVALWIEEHANATQDRRQPMQYMQYGLQRGSLDGVRKRN